ncbi:MAG: cell division protein FtsZ [Clostridiaceae bacterium]|nr:cell division protein FtsZ [Clostridiaceae bacterium]
MSDYRLGFSMEEEPFAAIKVVGVGGGGCNAVDRMIDSAVQGIDFISINTDHQALARSKAPTRIQIGEKITRGLGCGADPSVGEKAAEESKDEIAQAIRGTDMLFITAGMGGGTGTGAAPIVAQIARELNILTVAVVTRPFRFEGPRRLQNAERGIREIEKYVDSLIVVANDKLLEITDENTSIDDAFNMADQVLKFGVAGISDLVAIPGLINLDLADVRRVMTNAGVCHMGIGRASGESRASVAVKQAISSPLLDTTIEGARGVILNFTGGRNMKLHEIDDAASVVRDAVSGDADIIVGAVIDPTLEDEIMITVIASGFEGSEPVSVYKPSTSTLSRNNPPVTGIREPVRAPSSPSSAFGKGSAKPAQERQPDMPQFLFGDPVEAKEPVRQEPQVPAGFPQVEPYRPHAGYPQQNQQPVRPQQYPRDNSGMKPNYGPGQYPPQNAGPRQVAPPQNRPAGQPPQGSAPIRPNRPSAQPAPRGQEPPMRPSPEKKNKVLPWFLTDNDNLDE